MQSLMKLLLTVVCWSTFAFYTTSQKVKYHHLFIKRLNNPETTEYYCDVVPKNYEFNRNLTLYECLGSLEAWAQRERETPMQFHSRCSGVLELHNGKATLFDSKVIPLIRTIEKVIYSCDEGYTLFPKTNTFELVSNCVSEEWTHPNVTCQNVSRKCEGVCEQTTNIVPVAVPIRAKRAQCSQNSRCPKPTTQPPPLCYPGSQDHPRCPKPTPSSTQPPPQCYPGSQDPRCPKPTPSPTQPPPLCYPGSQDPRCSKILIESTEMESSISTQSSVDINEYYQTSMPSVPDITREDSSNGCLLPQEVGNRLFCHYSCSQCIFNPSSTCSYLFGEQRLQAVTIQCISGYGLNYNQDHSWSTCFNNTWVPSLPECKRVCPPLESDSLHIRCFNGISEVNCSRPQLPGTSVTYNCRASHREYPSLSTAGVYRRSIFCREIGTWSRPLPECEPICGVSQSNATITPAIVDGEESELGTFPWHSGLYRRNRTNRENWDYICGGSLLSNRIILTAAHCVFQQSPGDLKVALGKKHSSWSHQELYTVKRDVSDIKVPPEYIGGATSYTWDIALVMLNESVQLNNFVMPVCWGEPDFHLARDDVGYVVGWGNTSPGGKNSEILLQNTVSILENTECRKRTSFILTVDKFCGGKNAVSVVQKGDSGGGLTAIVNGINFIFGIVSINWNELSMFTNVSWTSHQRWLENEMLRIDSK